MLTNKDVHNIARLSRLHVSEAEAEQYRETLGSILTYVDQLQAIDTNGVPEFQHALSAQNVFRADEASLSETERASAIALFSGHKGDLLEVQAVFDSKSE